MPGFIPQDTLDEIRSRIDIVDMISDYVQLKKKGQNYIGPCPFHQEKDPSFTVSPEKQIFYCFGCGAGGNIFKFLMLYEGLSFPEAAQTLAQRAGVTLHTTRQGDYGRRKKKIDLAIRVNTLAKDFFQQILLKDQRAAPAREYLKKRGLSQQVIDQFDLGFAPDGWNSLVNHLGKEGISPDTLVGVGLASRGKSRVYDRFRSRIIFPIRDVTGNIVGFGGRITGKGEPKYLNTAETDYFNKSRLMYGLDQARRQIRKFGNLILMEGYMDVIAAHQFGISNAVASLGTSLTREQVQLLMRYTRDVLIAYDADAAGVSAALRGLDLMQELGCRVRVITIPGEKDPDEFLHHYGQQGWQELVLAAEPLLEYKFRQIKSGVLGQENNKPAILEQILPNLLYMRDEVERTEAIKFLAARLHTSWDAVASEYKKFTSKKRKKSPDPGPVAGVKFNHPRPLDARTRAEKMLLRLMLDDFQLVTVIQGQLGKNIFRYPVYRQIFEKVLPLIETGNYKPALAFDVLDEKEQEVLGNLLMENTPGGKSDEILPSYIEAMQRFINKERRENLIDTLLAAEKAGDQKRVSELLGKLQTLF